MTETRALGRADLAIDPEAEADRIGEALVDHLAETTRRGVVVVLAGDVDSSVTAALCVRALGHERVRALHLPERESSPETLRRGRLVADWLGVDCEVEDITPILEAAGCYRRRDEAIRAVCPSYTEGWRAKVVLPGVLDSERLRLYSAVVEAPDGTQSRHRLTAESCLAIAAATSLKPRVRALLAQHHADRLHHVVAGSIDRAAHDQGLFVKLGDGAADLQPLAHLYRTQLHALAAYLGVPEQIDRRPPAIDTWTLPLTQEEFYFSLPWEQLDLCLYAHDRGVPASAVAVATGFSEEQVERVLRDIDQKRRSTRHLHLAPRLVAPVDLRYSR